MTEAAPRRILAVDFGERRTGLAGTDPSGTIVSPLETLSGLSDQDCAREIATLARERGTEVIVVGLPLAARGEVGHRAKRTLEFVAQLKRVALCRVVTTDETHSTDEAHQLLKQGGLKASRRKKLADSVAAMVILGRYRREPGGGS